MSHRSDFTDVFEVLVGAGAKQRRFTVHHDLITKRSKFFRAARSERWTLDKSKPADLQHCDPDIFANYLHCVYHDTVPLYDRWKDGDDINASYAMELMCRETWFADKYYEHLVKLYTTADSLEDPITANMVVDEVRRISQKACPPLASKVKLAFDNTVLGDNMRKVLADIFVSVSDARGDEDLEDVDYPEDFLKLVVERFKTMRGYTRVEDATTKIAEKTLWALGDDECGRLARRQYHREI